MGIDRYKKERAQLLFPGEKRGGVCKVFPFVFFFLPFPIVWRLSFAFLFLFARKEEGGEKGWRRNTESRWNRASAACIRAA